MGNLYFVKSPSICLRGVCLTCVTSKRERQLSSSVSRKRQPSTEVTGSSGLMISSQAENSDSMQPLQSSKLPYYSLPEDIDSEDHENRVESRGSTSFQT
jgi:hypothetical protein